MLLRYKHTVIVITGYPHHGLPFIKMSKQTFNPLFEETNFLKPIPIVIDRQISNQCQTKVLIHLPVITMSKQPLHTHSSLTPSDSMGEQMQLTNALFALEEETNIANNNNNWPLPLAVAQEETRPHQQSHQLALSTPHRPSWRRKDGEMVCVPLAPIPTITPHSTQHLLPLQATTHHGGHPYMLVCPPLPRNVGAGMWLHQAEMVCGSVLATPLSYEEGSEVVCGGVGWGRTAQSLPHQTGNTTGPSSVVCNNLGAINTRPPTTHHYIPHLSPRRTTSLNAPVAVNAHFSQKCHSSEERECTSKSGTPREAVGDPPHTQQLVPGRIS